MERRPALARCRRCDSGFAVAEHGYACPDCGAGGARIVGGEEFFLAAFGGDR